MKKKRKAQPTPADTTLRNALKTAYLARAKLFAATIRATRIDELKKFLETLDAQKLTWTLQQLGISQRAFSKVKTAGVAPHLVFCHPNVIKQKPETLDYYRNLSALSSKGLSQLLGGLPRSQREDERLRVINSILSSIVEEMPEFDLDVLRAVIPAEIGAEIQGTWVNTIGQGAAARVEALITDFARTNDLVQRTEKRQVTRAGKKKTQRVIHLKNGWTIIFADEPDGAIRDQRGTLKVAIEIKGSMDKAGAQTRYGEAKKSFAKALNEHAQCETIYLASYFTDAVIEQIKADAQVRKWFNLIEILEDDNKRRAFLRELFVHQIRIFNSKS